MKTPWQALPWAVAMRFGDSGNFGRKPLTVATAIGWMAVFVGGISGLMFVLSLVARGNNTVAEQQAMQLWTGLGLLAGIVIAGICFGWHHARVNRPGAAEDVLAGLFPAAAICESGRVHLCGVGFQMHGTFRVMVCVQNLFDAPTNLSIASPAGLPPLTISLSRATAAAVACWIDLPLVPAQGPTFRLPLKFHTDGAGGRRVRPVRRTFLADANRQGALDVAMAAGGMIPIPIPSLQRGPQAAVGSCFMDRGGMFRAALAPPTAFAAPPPLPAPTVLQWWQAELWFDDKRADSPDTVAILLDVLRGA